MCVSLGSEPLAEEMPVDYDDLKLETTYALQVYNLLRGRAQTYGRDFSNVESIFKVLNIPPNSRGVVLELLVLIDNDMIDSEIKKTNNGIEQSKNNNSKNTPG